MPRPAKPYLERGWSISRPRGEYIRLCPKSDGLTEAKRLLNEHLAQRTQEKERNGGPAVSRLTMSEVFAMFLGGLLCLLGWLLTGIAGFRSERPEIVLLYFAGGFVCWGLLFLGILGWAALLHLMVEGVAI